MQTNTSQKTNQAQQELFSLPPVSEGFPAGTESEDYGIPLIRRHIEFFAKLVDDPRKVLGLTEPLNPKGKPQGKTQSEALRARKSLAVPTQWLDMAGKVHGTTNAVWQNAAALNKLIRAVAGDTVPAPKRSNSQSDFQTESAYKEIVAELKGVALRGKESIERAVQIVAKFQERYGKSKDRLRVLAGDIGVDVSTLYAWRKQAIGKAATPKKKAKRETEIAYVVRLKSNGRFYSSPGHYHEFTLAHLYDNASDALDGCDGTVEVLKVTCTLRPIVQN